MNGATRRIRLLYVDDDQALARLVQRRLSRLDYDVELAPHGQAGLQRIRDEAFDVVALDHYMPELDGLETLAALAEVADAPPVVFVTAADEGRLAVAAIKAGARDYVIKDASGDFVELLHNAICMVLSQTALRREKLAAEQALAESHARLEKLTETQAVLMQEVNHRVSNSLQLIASLLRMQASRVRDTAAADSLAQAINRVHAVTHIHRRLYTSEDVQSVAIDAYLAGLIADLEETLAGGTGAHRILLETADVRVPTDKAVAIGVIVNELVTNAVKYAYADGPSGDIRVRFERLPDGRLRLTVEDDGAGFNAEAAPKGTGLGSMIVDSMAGQLRTTIEHDPAHRGTRLSLAFDA